MTFRKILCPIDFSPGSQQAMRAAVRLAHEAEAELVLVHAWYVQPIAFAGEYTFPADVVRQMSDDAKHGLEVASREATSLGAKRVSAKLVIGPPWSTIVGMLEDATFDLVVLGTHGRTGLARILLGSVAEMVVRHAPCSVLAVRPDGEVKAFTNILCPVDFSESSQQAVDLAADVVTPGGAGITLLHVIELPVAYTVEAPPVEFARDLDKRAAKSLDEWAVRLRARVAVPVTTRTRSGRPGAQTLAVLGDDPKIDLVVMGSHCRTGLTRVLLGSVVEKVVRHARCPVLVARKRA